MSPAPADRAVTRLLLVFAIYELATGLLLWGAPGYFFEHIGPYDASRNEHYMADNAGWYLALGAATLVAVRRPAWRTPVLALSLFQNVLHLVSHLVDVGESHPAWHGPLDAALLLLTMLLLAWMLARSTRTPSPAQSPRSRSEVPPPRRDPAGRAASAR
jgi:hypothetical protein